MSLTIIVPTIGRNSLERTFDSIKGLKDGDEVLVVSDGPSLLAKTYWEQSGLPGRFIEIDGPHNDWGHEARNIALPMVKTSHVMHMDDDDVYTDGAIEIVRKAITKEPDKAHIFRMLIGYYNIIVWKDTNIKSGNVGTPMIVHPSNVYGRWEPVNKGDFGFIRDTCAKLPGVVWHKDIIANVRFTKPNVIDNHHCNNRQT